MTRSSVVPRTSLRFVSCAALCAFMLSPTAHAQETGAAKAASTAQKPKSVSTPAPGQTPRDPEGIKGISPYWEAINRGDAQFAALNYEAAAKEYRAAIVQDPKNPLGHMRMCELSIKHGALPQAYEFIDAALRYAGTDRRSQAQAAFLLAGIAELQLKADEALAGWTKYKQLDEALPNDPKTTPVPVHSAPAAVAPQVGATTNASPGDASSPEGAAVSPQSAAASPQGGGPLPITIHSATAYARISIIEARKKLIADYAPVLERIRKNVEAADEATGSAAGSGTAAGSSRPNETGSPGNATSTPSK